MYVIYHSSDSFAEVTGVSIASLFANNRDADNIHVLYIEKEIKEENKRKLRNLADEYGRELEFMPMPDWSKKIDFQLESSKSRWLGMGYNRLFLTEFIPEEIDKVLYLDSDTIIERSIKSLWETELDGYYMAGVDDCLSRYYRSLIGLSGDGIYCNAGVLLINLKKWREDNVCSKFVGLLRKRNGMIVFNDQSILNELFKNQILILPQQYNVNSLVYLFSYQELMTLRKPYHYSYTADDLDAAKNTPVITHFTGNFYVLFRPWEENSDHPHKNAYLKYRQLTAWKNEPLKLRTKKISKWEKLCHRLPRTIMIYSVSFLYNVLRPLALKRKMKRI